MAATAIGMGDPLLQRKAVRNLVLAKFSWGLRPGLSILPYLFENGFSLSEINAMGFKATPLHFVAFQGSVDDLKILIREGANVEEEGHDEITPLILAAYKEHIVSAKILLLNGAQIPNINRFDKNIWQKMHSTLSQALEELPVTRKAVLVYVWESLQGKNNSIGTIPLDILKNTINKIQKESLPEFAAIEPESESDEDFGGCFD